MTADELRLYKAARDGNAELVRSLLRQGVNPNAVYPGDSNHGFFLARLTPLMAAAGSPRSNAETVRALLEGGASITAQSAGGVTAVWYAAGGLGFRLKDIEGQLEEGHPYRDWGGGDVDRLRLLLDAGGDPDETASNDRPLVSEAAVVGDPDRLRLLMERGASVEATSHPGKNRWISTPLFEATAGGSLECVKLILGTGFPVVFEDSHGNAFQNVATVEIASYLWELGLRPPRPSSGVEDAASAALQSGRYEVGEFLLTKLQDGQRKLQYLNAELKMVSGTLMDSEAVRVLLRLGADVNDSAEHWGTPLHTACWQGDGNNGRPTEVVRETLEVLIAAGADINRNLPRYGTPLHQAVGGDWESPTATRCLIEHAAIVDVFDEDGETPLFVATSFNSKECVELLLAAGANPEFQRKRGKKPAR